MNRAALAWSMIVPTVLSGCASTMSGVGGTNQYACRAPEGTVCTSVSGVYANTAKGDTPSAKSPERNPIATLPKDAPTASVPPLPVAASKPSIRSNPRVLRLWIAPWEDADGDLHEAALVHVLVDTGRWLIEHVRPVARSRMDGAAMPTSPPPPRAEKPASDAPQPTRFPIPPGELPTGRDPSSTGR